MNKAQSILEHLEEHCNEKLACSHRLRWQIIGAFQREIDKYNLLRSNIGSLITEEDNATYNSHTHTTRKRPDAK